MIRKLKRMRTGRHLYRHESIVDRLDLGSNTINCRCPALIVRDREEHGTRLFCSNDTINMRRVVGCYLQLLIA